MLVASAKVSTRRLVWLAALAMMFIATSRAYADEYHGDFGGPEPEQSTPRQSESQDPFENPYLGRQRRNIPSGGDSGSSGAPGPAPAPAVSTDASGQVPMPPLFAKASSVYRDRVPVPPGRTFAMAAAAQAATLSPVMAASGPVGPTVLAAPQVSSPNGIMPGTEPPAPDGLPMPAAQAPIVRDLARDPRLSAVMADLEQSTITVEEEQRAREKEKEEKLAARRGPNRLPARLLEKVQRDR